MPDKKKKPKPPKPLNRKIHIGDEIWTYSVGRGGINILSPQGVKTHVPLDQILGLDWYTIERARWKKTNNANVEPQIVKNWILEHLK